MDLGRKNISIARFWCNFNARKFTKKSPSTCQLSRSRGSIIPFSISCLSVPKLTMNESPQELHSLSIRSSPPRRSCTAFHACARYKCFVVYHQTTYFRGECRNFFSSVEGHMNALLIPSPFIVWIETEADPKGLCPLGGFLLGECIFDYYVSFFQKLFNLFS